MTNHITLLSHTIFDKLRRIPDDFLVLTARLGIAAYFWRAGQTKVDGFELTSGTRYLFAQEYKVPLLPPDVAAWTAVGAEHLFPILLVIGLATRFSALGLLGMTAIIQVFVYPASWPDHLMWAAVLLLIAVRGPGWLALDGFLSRKLSLSAASKPLS